MRKFLFGLILAIVAPVCLAQQSLPNLSYSASLNAVCSTPNAVCSGSAVPTGTGVSGLLGTALDITSANYAIATVTVSGTYAGATVNFDFSDPSGGVSYFQELCVRTDANIMEAFEALPTNQIRAWQCPVFATTRFRVRCSAISSGAVAVWVTISQTGIDASPTAATLPQATAASSGTAFSNCAQATLTTSVNCKASTGNVYGFIATNGAASVCWIQLINSSGAGTLGTGVIASYPLPALATQPVVLWSDIPLANFSTGIAVGIATTPTGSTACGTGGNITVLYE